jgi:hypothetical protein
MEQLREGELFKLKQQVEEAQANGRDLLNELVGQLEKQIVHAREELERATA